MSKLLSYFTAMLVAATCFSQPVLTPQQIPCWDLNQADVVGLTGISAVDCIETDGNVNFNSGSHYSVKAGEHILFQPETHIAPDNTHLFHAYIEQPNFDLAWYEPTTAGEVGQFEKLELGLQFDHIINDQILNFINDQSGNKLNPYEPDEIDIVAEFYYYNGNSWEGPTKAFGFYYQEYDRQTTEWIEIPTQHNFRIRFTPRKIGTWRCNVIATINQQDVYQSELFYFQCVPSFSKGFIRVGDNNRYFRIENEPFFPVGQNLTSPYYGFGDPNAGLVATPEHWDEYYLLMEELNASGANYFRNIVCPWSSEIEFETIGNYSKRMPHAWEFDRMIEKCKELDLRMHYNMQIHYAFEAPTFYGITFWDWSKFGDTYQNNPQNFCNIPEDEGYCYRNFLDTEDPIEFFTSSSAKKYYKNRLRYMISRWGYSTSIGVFELMSEINNAGNVNPVGGENDPNGFTSCEQYPINDPYWSTFFYSPYNEDIGTVGPVIDSWQNEMCQYIKDELEHLDHPLAVSYAGQPNFSGGDQSFSSPFVDIATYNDYGISVIKPQLNYEQIELKYHSPSPLNPEFIPKPMMFSEYGGLGGCDNDVSFKKTLYLTPFIGVAGSAMNWDWQENEGGQWAYINSVREFMEGVPLDEEDWKPGTPIIQSNLSVETYYLKSEMQNNNRKVLGVVANRTFNYYTNATDPQSECIADYDEDLIYTTPENFTYQNLPDGIVLPDVAQIVQNQQTTTYYQVNWYNASTLSLVHSDLIQVSSGSNLTLNLELPFPGILTSSDIQPILFFEAFPVGSTIKTVNDQNVDNIGVQQEQIEELEQKESKVVSEENPVESDDALGQVTVYPNPTSGKIFINLHGWEVSGSNYILTNSTGLEIKRGFIRNSNVEMDFSVYNSGVYFLQFMNGSGSALIKIIKI